MRRLIVVMFCFSLVAASCGESGDGDGSGNSGTTRTLPPILPTTTTTSFAPESQFPVPVNNPEWPSKYCEDTSGQGIVAGGGSLEGAYSKDRMLDFLIAVNNILVEFVTECTENQALLVDNVLMISSNTTHEGSECLGKGPNGQLDYIRRDTSFGYCSPDKTVYLGQEALWYYYNDGGDAAATIGYMHEVAHHWQNVMDVPKPKNWNPPRLYELQADCVAGSLITWLIARGYFEVEDDSADVDRLIDFIANNAIDETKLHGSHDERFDAISVGMLGGLPACNQYTPGHPVYAHSNL